MIREVSQRLTGAGQLLLVLLVFSSSALAQRNLQASTASAAVAPGLRVALVIGNAAYREAPLGNPVNDATDIAKVLQDSGFKVTLKRNAGTRDMRQAIREFAAELRRAEVGLFYFAGHGMQVRGANYLVPVGADIQSEADAEDLAIDASYALRTMEDAQVKVSIVILDACRNNPYARSFRSASRGLAQMSAATGSLIAFATAPGAVAADGSGRNGVYTKHLLASLSHPDTDILKVFQRTRAGVVKETAGKQTPWESTSMVGDFYFKPPAAARIAQSAPETAAPNSAAVEMSYWESVKASTNAEELKAYLDQYPSGAFAALARARVKALEPALPPRQVASVAPALSGAARAATASDLVGRWFSEGVSGETHFKQITVRRSDGTLVTEFKTWNKAGPLTKRGALEGLWIVADGITTSKCRSVVADGQSIPCTPDRAARIVSWSGNEFELEVLDVNGSRLLYKRVPDSFRLE